VIICTASALESSEHSIFCNPFPPIMIKFSSDFFCIFVRIVKPLKSWKDGKNFLGFHFYYDGWPQSKFQVQWINLKISPNKILGLPFWWRNYQLWAKSVSIRSWRAKYYKTRLISLATDVYITYLYIFLSSLKRRPYFFCFSCIESRFWYALCSYAFFYSKD
jgi:hypothetical protein